MQLADRISTLSKGVLFRNISLSFTPGIAGGSPYTKENNARSLLSGTIFCPLNYAVVFDLAVGIITCAMLCPFGAALTENLHFIPGACSTNKQLVVSLYMKQIGVTSYTLL